MVPYSSDGTCASPGEFSGAAVCEETRPMIVVTTPTGHIGAKLLEELLDAGETVRVIVRDPAKLPARHRKTLLAWPGTVLLINKAPFGSSPTAP